MANERLCLACTHCLHDPKTALADCVFYFAKYYPSTGWYTMAKVNFQEELDAWFDLHVHGTLLGQFVTLFQSQIDPTAQSKVEILERLATCLAAAGMADEGEKSWDGD